MKTFLISMSLVLGIAVVAALLPEPHRIQAGMHCLGAQRLIAQSKDMPPPGNPDHKEPAPGAFCHWPEDGKPDGAGDCACHKTCYENTGPDGEPNGTIGVQEDNAQCRSACFKDHCHCAVPCL